MTRKPESVSYMRCAHTINRYSARVAFIYDNFFSAFVTARNITKAHIITRNGADSGIWLLFCINNYRIVLTSRVFWLSHALVLYPCLCMRHRECGRKEVDYTMTLNLSVITIAMVATITSSYSAEKGLCMQIQVFEYTALVACWWQYIYIALVVPNKFRSAKLDSAATLVLCPFPPHFVRSWRGLEFFRLRRYRFNPFFHQLK